jgi:O-antigen/teichoic acid export membrane protein
VYFSLNIFLLIYLKGLIDTHEILESIYVENHEVTYIFIANLIASIVSLLLLAPFYFEINYRANIKLLKKMLAYGFPILISGLAFTINETFDKILLDFLLPTSIAKTQIGMYAACYKLAIFMTLFSTAYKLAIEPFFFREADKENSTKSYALVLEIFVIIGSSILVLVVASLDILKVVFIGDPEYWQALYIVPIILIANFCLGIYQNLSVWYKVTDKTIFAAYISSAGALITLILNIILIPKFSYLGSAVATLLAYFIMALLSYHFGKKHYPIPYNSEKILFYFVLSVSLSSISFYGFRDNLLVGILCILIMNLVILLKEKRRINKLFKLLA